MRPSVDIRSTIVRLLRLAMWGIVSPLVPVQFMSAADMPRPNILWITSEDHGPHLGCYGDSYATTPNIDRLASQGIVYTRVWSCAPVCAPARTTLISGLYPPSTGSEHMRSLVPYPAGKQMFPQMLRAAGYYCTNNAKEDYNLAQPGNVWDASSGKAHWKQRAAGQPFFAVFNSNKSHESQLRKRPHTAVHDPTGVRVPAYHPDTPEVRRDWAQYYDTVSEADVDAGQRLAEIEQAGLTDNTIVFYFADHGSGMPRNKRSGCDSGLHVPLVIYVPQQFRGLLTPDARPGEKCDRLVSFVDFAPTVLSLAGVEPPDWMQGRAFLGTFAAPPNAFVFGFRGRMDERYDLVRSVTDGRYVYLRNYLPHKIYGQHVSYMFQTPTTQVWQRLHDSRKLTPQQDRFWQPKPPEELYDLASDRDEVQNLADLPEHRDVLIRFRNAQQAWERQIRDVGFLPEGEIHSRSQGTTPYDMGHDETKYPFERIFAAAELASRLEPDANEQLLQACSDADSAVRYWGALGLLMRGKPAVAAGRAVLKKALSDASPDVRIVAAEALAKYGAETDRDQALETLRELGDWSRNSVFVAMAALNATDALGEKAATIKAELLTRPQGTAPHARYSSYVPRLLQPETAGE